MSQTSQGRTVMVQGRIVWTVGDLFKGRTKVDYNTKQPRRNTAGEVMMEYGFGLAVPKANLAQTGPGQPGEIWAAIHAEAMTMFPTGQIPPSFAMKYKDGDSAIDEKGVPYSQREGYAGHLVFSCTTSLPIKFFRYENGANVLINEGIKCGDYVNVQLHIKAHGAQGQGKAGLYLNPNAVQFLGYGKEIINTPSGDQIFGTAAPPMPTGASATPLVPQAGTLVPPPGAAAPLPTPGYPPQAAPMPQPAAPAVAPATPHYGVLPQAHQPPPGGQPMPTYPQAPQGYPQPAAPAPQPGYAPQPPAPAAAGIPPWPGPQQH